MRKNKTPARVNHDRWLVSYADFITLLFAFFVVLYASSQVDKKKAGNLAQAIQGAFQQLGAFKESSATTASQVGQVAESDKLAAELNKALNPAKETLTGDAE